VSFGQGALGLDELGRQALLDARSAALARRGVAAARAATLHSYLLCACGADRYGLPLEAVAHVMPARACTAVPGAPPALLGLVARSGRVVSVLGLAGALGRTTPDAEPGHGHFVVLRGNAGAVALAVDRVLGVVAVEASSAPETPSAGPSLGTGAVSGYAAAGPAGEDGFVVIDLPRLLRRYLP
jgi:purine-binding chemotaxis protein CheW